MVLLSRYTPSATAVAGALLALLTVNAPARADDPTTNVGPVPAREPILATIGGQRLIAFFVPERGSCAVSAIIWKDAGVRGALCLVARQGQPAPGRDDPARKRRPAAREPAVRRRCVDPRARRARGGGSDQRTRQQLTAANA